MRKIIISLLLMSCSTSNDDKMPIRFLTQKHFTNKPCVCEFEYFYSGQFQHYAFEDSCSAFDLGDTVFKNK